MPQQDFSDIVAKLSDGKFNRLATKRLADLIAKCKETGGTGKLTLTFTVKPQGDDAVTIKTGVKVTTPEPAVADSKRFVAEDGELLSTDPRQPSLPNVISLPRKDGN